MASRAGSSLWRWGTVVVTAGSLVVAALLAPGSTSPPTEALAWLLFLGSSTHAAATGWLFSVPEIRAQARRHPGRYLRAPVILVALGATAAALLNPGVMAWALLGFFAWQFHHFQKQNLGLGALGASSAGIAGLSRWERRAIMAAGACGIAALLAHPALLQLRVSPVLAALSPATAVAYACTLTAGVVALARRRRGHRPPSFCALYGTALLFPLPIFLFTSPFAAVAGMTIAHGLQYLILLGLVAAGAEAGVARRRSVLVLCSVALAGGTLLSVLSHLHGAAPPLRLLFGLYLGLVCSHFVVDAGLWRLRDPFARAFLTGRAPLLFPGSTLASSPFPSSVPRQINRLPIDRLPI